MSEIVVKKEFSSVLSIIKDAKNKFYQQANTILTATYWEIGKFLSVKISEDTWGKGTINELAKWLKQQTPNSKGFSTSNLWRMKQFYEAYSSDEKLVTLSQVLSWSHYSTLIGRCKSPEELLFYSLQSKQSRWSVRELRKQIDSGMFERIVLADQKLSPVVRDLPQDVTGIFKDAYLIDFANLSEPYDESDLQKAIVGNLKQFLLELGRGFTFVGEEVTLQVGHSDFKLDLLFYHRDLQCLVAFELKRGTFDPRDLGQLSFYLESLDRQEKRPHENPSIGVLLCRSKDDEVVEFALSSSASPAMVAEYEIKMVEKELLRTKINEWYQLLVDVLNIYQLKTYSSFWVSSEAPQ